MKAKNNHFETATKLLFSLLLVIYSTATKSAARDFFAGNYIGNAINNQKSIPGDTDVTPKPAPERAQALTSSMNCEVGLLSGQVQKVYGINLESCVKMDSVTLVSKGDIKSLEKGGKAVDENRNKKLREVLTPKQFATYERISRGNKHAIKNTEVCRRDISQTW